MSNGVLSEAARRQLFSRNGSKPYTPEELSAEWTCKKRDGTIVPFEPEKIRAALRKCFSTIARDSDTDVDKIEKITTAVCNIIAAQKKTCPEVEEVQRLVVQQLWVEGLFEAGEHYQNYREEHRKQRRDKPASAEYLAILAEDAKHFASPIQLYQFYSKFARWNYTLKRRETWSEACRRVINWFRTLPRVQLTDGEWDILYDSLYRMETSCAMRVVQMAGPALERCHVGVYNCAYLPLQDPRSFAELLYVLMSGGGCGFSVEDRYISQLPRIKHQTGVKHTYIVPDDTEGWCDAYLFGLEHWFNGEDVWYDVTRVRNKNTPLKTKGGRASGPEPLLALLAFARKLILSRQGKILTDIDCHDLACMTGKIVQVGGVRRAATISVSDLDSSHMRDAKSGNWYERAVWRTMANNSAAYDGRPDMDNFLAEFTALVRSKSGERGIFNRKAVENSIPERREKIWYFGINPCGEIILRPYQFCNLSIVVARPHDTEESLMQKVRVAAYWGCMQKTATNFKYIRDEWRKNCEEEALLGVDITGHADCPLLRFGAPGRAELLRKLRDEVAKVDYILSDRFGVKESAANTCVKPSGDSSVFFNCASGCSPWFAEYIMRWVREPATSPVAVFLKDVGVPCATAPEDPSLVVLGFPRKAPKDSMTVKDMSALDQLNNWMEWKDNWAEHSVSCTVYVNEDEWPDVMAWCYRHFDRIVGLSFLPRDNGIYTYAPNEAMTAEQYETAMTTFPAVPWAKLCQYEDEDMTQSAQTPACLGGACSV